MSIKFKELMAIIHLAFCKMDHSQMDMSMKDSFNHKMVFYQWIIIVALGMVFLMMIWDIIQTKISLKWEHKCQILLISNNKLEATETLMLKNKVMLILIDRLQNVLDILVSKQIISWHNSLTQCKHKTKKVFYTMKISIEGKVILLKLNEYNKT
jgi:hypothetical protein